MKPADRRADSLTAQVRPGPVWMRADGSGVLLYLHLQPGARKTALSGEHGNRLKVMVAAPPLDGRANEALVGWVAAQLGLPRRQVRVTAGLRSRDKTVRADGIDAGQVLLRLAPK